MMVKHHVPFGSRNMKDIIFEFVRSFGVLIILRKKLISGALDYYFIDWIGTDSQFYSLLVICNESQILSKDVIAIGSSDESLSPLTSSYPGFKYTVIIQFDYFKETNSLSLKTKYGQYVYTLDSVYPAFIEDNELVNKNTGDKVNLLDPKTERLAIYNSVTKKVFQYTLKKGTTINIE